MATNKVTNISNVTNVTNVTNITTITNVTKNVTMPSPTTSVTSDNDECQNILDNISKCKCCQIHTINRPSIYKPFVEVPYRIDVPKRPSNTYIDIYGVSKITCYCDCRILARMVCRNHPNYTTKNNIKIL
jgi:hypothetical protein